MKMMTGIKRQWQGFGCSEIGPLHQKLDLPNQDAFYLGLEGKPLVIAVSDGLGSKSLSHLGSKAVGQAAERLSQIGGGLVKLKPEDVLKKFHTLWLDELKGQNIDQCRCTALFALIYEDQIFAAQLGDGDCCLIFSSQAGQQVEFLTQMNDEYFANQTDSLGGKFDFSKWKYNYYPTSALTACFMTTDGIADDLKAEARKGFYLGIFDKYQNLTAQEIQKDVHSWLSNWPVKGHSDDKTLVGLLAKEKATASRLKAFANYFFKVFKRG